MAKMKRRCSRIYAHVCPDPFASHELVETIPFAERLSVKPLTERSERLPNDFVYITSRLQYGKHTFPFAIVYLFGLLLPIRFCGFKLFAILPLPTMLFGQSCDF